MRGPPLSSGLCAAQIAPEIQFSIPRIESAPTLPSTISPSLIFHVWFQAFVFETKPLQRERNVLMMIPPHLAVSDVVRRMKGRPSHRVQREFPDLRKRCWGRHFWARGYFCPTSGNVTDDIMLQYTGQHADKPAGVNR